MTQPDLKTAVRWRWSLLSLSVFAFADVDGASAGCRSCRDDEPIKAKPEVPLGEVKIFVYPVRLADDDGAHGSSVTAASFTAWLNGANAIFQRSGLAISFLPAPEIDWTAPPVRSTLMNRDCIPTGVDPAPLTAQDINQDGRFNADDFEMLCASRATTWARMAEAYLHPDRVVVVMRNFADRAEYDGVKKQWSVKRTASDYGYSGGDLPFVVTGGGPWSGEFLAHEIGHYLHLSHTHYYLPPDAQTAAKTAADWLKSTGLQADQAKRAFDGDAYNVPDTRPDPGPELFAAFHQDACTKDPGKTAFDVTVVHNGESYVAQFEPERDLVMSYFKECPFKQRFSAGQALVVERALMRFNRRALLHPELQSCYEANKLAEGPADLEALVAYRKAIVDRCVATLDGVAVKLSSETLEPEANIAEVRDMLSTLTGACPQR